MALVSYTDTEDEDAEVIQVPITSQPLVSLDHDSVTLIKPQVQIPTIKNKEICPPSICKMKRANKRTWSVVSPTMCWHHQRISSKSRDRGSE